MNIFVRFTCGQKLMYHTPIELLDTAIDEFASQYNAWVAHVYEDDYYVRGCMSVGELKALQEEREGLQEAEARRQWLDKGKRRHEKLRLGRGGRYIHEIPLSTVILTPTNLRGEIHMSYMHEGVPQQTHIRKGDEIYAVVRAYQKNPPESAMASVKVPDIKAPVMVPTDLFVNPEQLFVQTPGAPGVEIAQPIHFEAFKGWVEALSAGLTIRLFNINSGLTRMLIRDYADLLRFQDLRREWSVSNARRIVHLEGTPAAHQVNVPAMSTPLKVHATPKDADPIQKAVDPDHYKGYIEEMQWLDAMSQIPTLRKPERFIAAVELQIRKYMDRNGQKDLPLQEFQKANFYMVYLIMYMKGGCKPIKAADVRQFLKGL